MSAPILSSFDWQIQGLGTRHLRAGFLTDTGTGRLQVRSVDSDDVVTWVDLVNGLNSTKFNFTSFWDTDRSQDLLLFVNGSSGIYEWSGGMSTIESSTNSSGVISVINVTPTYGGSGYVVGDVLDIITGGTGGKVIVESISNFAMTGVAVFTPGTSYLVNDILTLTPLNGSGIGGTVKVTSVGGSGDVTGISIVNQGSSFILTTYAVTGGAGSGAVINVTSVANGAVRSFALDAAGINYTTGAGKSTSGGSGTGATVEITSTVTGSITIPGDKTVLQEGFYSSGVLIINGSLYTYSGLVGNDFVGISPDVTGEAIDSLILQQVKYTLNSAMTAFSDTFKNSLIATLDNQIWVGDLNSNLIYVSKTDDYKDFSSSSPRQPGEGALLVADSACVAFIPQEEFMYVSAGLDEWYQSKSTLSADQESEALQIIRLKTTTGQGTQSQSLTSKIGNNVVFVSNEPVVNTLGRVDNVVLTPQITDISYSIVNDINSYDFTDGSVFYFQKFIYVSIPKQSIVRIYNMTNETKKGGFYWEAPQTLPISCFSIIDGELYGHSYQASETYKLFTGYNDNGHPYLATAVFSYQQDGVRSASKSFNEFYTEGYISANTILTNGFNFDTDGFQTTTSFPIDGSDTQIVGIKPSLASLGKSSLGKNPEGGDIDIAGPLPPKFRVIKTFPRVPYYEYQPFYSSLGVDQQWELIAFGAATSPTTEDNSPITE